MADYARTTTTTTTTLGALPGPLQTALRDRIASSQLTLPDDAAAFLTHSTRLRRSGLLRRLTGTADPDPEHLTALVLGPADVLVGTHGEQRGTAVLAARLDDVDVASLADRYGELATTVDDEGITITGFPVSVDGHSSRGSFFVGLGAPDGSAARTALTEAVRAAKAPRGG